MLKLLWSQKSAEEAVRRVQGEGRKGRSSECKGVGEGGVLWSQMWAEKAVRRVQGEGRKGRSSECKGVGEEGVLWSQMWAEEAVRRVQGEVKSWGWGKREEALGSRVLG
jgi:hypothetical protein